jgi:hypothetical protein
MKVLHCIIDFYVKENKILDPLQSTVSCESDVLYSFVLHNLADKPDQISKYHLLFVVSTKINSWTVIQLKFRRVPLSPTV